MCDVIGNYDSRGVNKSLTQSHRCHDLFHMSFTVLRNIMKCASDLHAAVNFFCFPLSLGSFLFPKRYDMIMLS